MRGHASDLAAGCFLSTQRTMNGVVVDLSTPTRNSPETGRVMGRSAESQGHVLHRPPRNGGGSSSPRQKCGNPLRAVGFQLPQYDPARPASTLPTLTTGVRLPAYTTEVKPTMVKP